MRFDELHAIFSFGNLADFLSLRSEEELLVTSLDFRGRTELINLMLRFPVKLYSFFL